MPYTAAANCSAMPDPYLRDLMSDCNLIADLSFLLAHCRNRTTKRTSNGRELERVGVEVERADRCRVASWLIGERELQLSGMQAENGWS
ncbi:hypothetical protein F2Q70_00042851 [Brassica cretica]|uniref:Uncharacterized protein n=1 Tax=Brassica cretica TaxID=69181 RepID=A0A8S9KIC8_BRACR|nr:hypothetical protein F2Q70_00042851 [Brassica cretica]